METEECQGIENQNCEDDGLSDDENWLMEDEECAEKGIKDIFNPEEITHKNLQELLNNCLKEHNFDLKKVVLTALKSIPAPVKDGDDDDDDDDFDDDDDYNTLKALNYVRHRTIVDKMRDPKVLEDEVVAGKYFQDDKFFAPILNEDPLLYLFQEMIQDELDDMSRQDNNLHSHASSERVLKQKEEEIELLKSKIEELKTKLTEVVLSNSTDVSEKSSPHAEKKDKEDPDGYYFDSYSALDIHREMLQDRPRTESYRDALNKVSKGKFVMDIGCGTGILCLFSARAGARKVIGIDAAEIIHQAIRIVKANNHDKTINLIKGKLEELDLLAMKVMDPEEKVDVLVSEWMGYGLLFESMLDSVLVARDRFLDKSNGIMVPSHASVYVQASNIIKAEKKDADFWNDVYGFDYSVLKEVEKKRVKTDSDEKRMDIDMANVVVVNHSSIVSSRGLVKEFDLKSVTVEELDFVGDFAIQMTGNQVEPCRSIVISFDCAMCPGITLSTATDSPYTHWQQTLLVVDSNMEKPKYLMNPGEQIVGKLTYQKDSDNIRNIVLKLHLKFPERFGQDSVFENYYQLS